MCEAALGAGCGLGFGMFLGGLWVLDQEERLGSALATSLGMALGGALICFAVGAIEALVGEIQEWPEPKVLNAKN